MEITSMFNVGEVVAITVICVLVMQAVKALILKEDLQQRWIPVICGVLGGILGIVGWKTMADFPAQDILSAIAVGIVSGLAATGAHQVVHQLTEKHE